MALIEQIKKNSMRVKNLSFYLLTTIINTLLMLVINPFYAKNLSHHDYAIIGFHNSFQTILLPLITFSFGSYYARHYYLTPENRRDVLRDTVNKMIFIWGSFSIFICFIVFYYFFKFKSVDIPFFPYFLFTILTVFANTFIQMQQLEYRLTKKAKHFFYLAISLRLCIIFSSIMLVIVIPLGAFGRMLAIAVCTAIYSLFTYRKMYSGNKIDLSIVKDALKFCWPLALSALLWYFLGGVDRIMLEELKDINNMALYNIAASFTAKIAIFYTALAQTMEPDIYRSIAAKRYRKMLFIALGIILLNAIPNVVFIILAKPALSLLTAGRYAEAFTFARILVFKNITASLYYTVILIIVGLGFTKSELLNRLFGAIASVFMFKFLISRYGYYGAAWGQSMSFLLMTIVGVVFILINKKKMILHNK